MGSVETSPRASFSLARGRSLAAAIDWAPWKQALAVALGTRLVFLFVAYVASWFLNKGQGAPSEGFFDLWAHWDGSLLLGVAEHGYTNPLSDPHSTAFFPLFPLLVGGLGALGIPYVIGGMLVSTAASVVALAYLYRLAEQDLGEGSGRRACLYLALFPTAVFLIAPYSESLFLAGAIPAFYYARRGRWGPALIPTMVATGTRFAGMFLLFGLALEFVQRQGLTIRKTARLASIMLVGALPMLAYGAYLAQVKGNALYFFIDQRNGWGRQFVGPVDSFLATWNTWASAEYPSNFLFAWRLEIVAAAVGVALVVWALRRSEWGYAGYMGSMLAVLMTSSWYFSIPRMLLSLFPAVLFLASFTKGESQRHEWTLLSLASVAALGVITFTSNSWFY